MIHQYKLGEYNIILDVNSGSVHHTDDVAYDIISLYETHSEEEIIAFILDKYSDRDDVNAEEIKLCIEDINELKKSGKLFFEAFYEDINLSSKENNSVKALCLHVAHTCNLNCEYCFASQGKYNGERALMSFEVGKKALDFLVKESGSHVNLEVDFFGGEPMMNFEVVKQLVEYARSMEKANNKNFRFTFTTNGMLLSDEVNEFLNKEMNNVVLSLDGRKEIHDEKRKDYSGKGSYDTIVPKFQKLVNSRNNKNYYIRGTFTHRNTDFTNDILHMLDLGFTELSMEPVVCKPDEEYALTNDDLDVLKEQYEILAFEMLKREKEGKPFTFYHYMLDLNEGPCIYKRLSGCGSGSEYLAVTPEGLFYPCHQFVGDENFIMGNIDEGITNNKLRDEFKNCKLTTKPECNDCWAKLYCAGGCAANSYHAAGNINGIYSYGCELFKKRIECAIMLNIARG